MDFQDEMDEAIQSGLEEFKLTIQKKIGKNRDYLQHFFWLRQSGMQMTVLNYLIKVHEDCKEENEDHNMLCDLTDYIDYVLECSEDKNIGEPLHQAIAAGKIRLAYHLLGMDQRLPQEQRELSSLQPPQSSSSETKQYPFDIDRRDNQGRTLISLILDLKIFEILVYLIKGKPSIHAATAMTSAMVMFQPIHQAIVLDYPDAIRLLANEGAQLANPLGAMKDTPLILAARLGKINAMEALLQFPIEQLDVDATNNHMFKDETCGHTAMEELCNHIANNHNKAESIRGVAMLLCRGAEPPVREEMRQLLCGNRIELLKAAHNYLEDKPELVDEFVSRCHLTGSALHNIVYADHSWGSSIRHLFGIPSDAAFMIEKLVTRKYDASEEEQCNGVPLSSATAENFRHEKNHLKLYAEFVRRYTQTYDSQLFTNRWSTMRWMIAEGNCNWTEVLEYAKNHPASRTRIVLRDMMQPISKLHIDIEEAENTPEQQVSI